MRDNTEAM